MTATMKAIVTTKYGSPEVLQLAEVEKPTPKDNEVLIKMHAAAITAGDVIVLKGEPFVTRFATGLLEPKNTIPGKEMAGCVVAVGQNVTQFQPGDEVFGYGRFRSSAVGQHGLKHRLFRGMDGSCGTMPAGFDLPIGVQSRRCTQAPCFPGVRSVLRACRRRSGRVPSSVSPARNHPRPLDRLGGQCGGFRVACMSAIRSGQVEAMKARTSQICSSVSTSEKAGMPLWKSPSPIFSTRPCPPSLV